MRNVPAGKLADASGQILVDRLVVGTARVACGLHVLERDIGIFVLDHLQPVPERTQHLRQAGFVSLAVPAEVP